MSKPGDIVSAFIAAIEAKDLDTALALVADDVSYENVPMTPIAGKAALRDTPGARPTITTSSTSG